MTHDWAAAQEAIGCLLGISMRRVAKDAGVSFSTVHRIESGKGFDSTSAFALMSWLDSPATPPECDLPPDGWWCSRERDHGGPCAARRTS